MSRKLLDKILTFLPLLSGWPLHQSVCFVQVKVQMNIFNFRVMLVSWLVVNIPKGETAEVTPPNINSVITYFRAFLKTKHVVNRSGDRNAWYGGQIFVTIPPKFFFAFFVFHLKTEAEAAS
jgi:hypothetical protein